VNTSVAVVFIIFLFVYVFAPPKLILF